MMNEQTCEKLSAMKLSGLARAFREYMNGQISADALTFEERFGMMVDTEWTERENRRLKIRLTKSRLRETACIEDIDYAHPRGLDRSVIQRLSACRWVRERENLLITGVSGLGKTWLACAFAQKACREGHSVLYTRAPRLLDELHVAQGSGSFAKTVDRIARPDILIIDDFGLAPLSDTERRHFFEVVEARHERRSTVVASQLAVKHWHDVVGEPTVADAVLDRLVSAAHRIELKGKETMRKKKQRA
jgi:DNA replication protein DnaC